MGCEREEGAMGRGDQLTRQWLVLQRLRRGRCSRRELARDFDVSLKTVARDIDVLSVFPIVETQEGIDVFYELMEGTRAPGLHLAAEEVGALSAQGAPRERAAGPPDAGACIILGMAMSEAAF